MTWAALLEQWQLIECDLQSVYGIDVDDTALMCGRPWRWLRVRIEGLLGLPAASFVQVTDPLDKRRVVNKPVYATRLQQHFFG